MKIYTSTDRLRCSALIQAANQG